MLLIMIILYISGIWSRKCP